MSDTTTPTPSLAERMYPSMAPAMATPAPAVIAKHGGAESTAAAGTQVPADPALDASGLPIVDPETITEPPMTAEEERAERLYAADGSPPTDGDYSAAVREAFDSMFQQARESGDEASLEAVREGKEQVLATMAELGVGNVGAREIAHVFSRFQVEPLDDDAVEAANLRSIAQLREKWGPRFDSNLRYARTAFAEACKRIPWLLQESQNGAGSDPAVIQHFAAVGRRLARKKS